MFVEYFGHSGGIAYMVGSKFLLALISRIRWEFSMKCTIALGLLAAVALAAAPVAPQAEKSQVAKMTLKVGDKKNVFLAVYVLAFTGG